MCLQDKSALTEGWDREKDVGGLSQRGLSQSHELCSLSGQGTPHTHSSIYLLTCKFTVAATLLAVTQGTGKFHQPL